MNITDNSNAVIILCSHLCVKDDIKPLETAEWSKVAQLLLKQKLQPFNILNFTDNDFKSKLNLNGNEILRYKKLIDRSGSIAFEIEKYFNIGIFIATRADIFYPKKLKNILGTNCPPLFYYAGDIEIANDDFIGMVGSRTVDECDVTFAKKIAEKAVNAGFSIVSGGAKGIDTVSGSQAVSMGGAAMYFLADSLFNKTTGLSMGNAIRDNRLLLISQSKPDSSFNTGMAMARNKFIYASSKATVVVKSEYNKGGTWTGAVENLKNDWCTTYCWDNKEYKGNQNLILKGAKPIDENWIISDIDNNKKQIQQYSLFDI